MTWFSLSWLLMTVLMVLMLVTVGPRHPPVIDEYEPLGSGRRAVAVFALVMLILCFTPFPIADLIGDQGSGVQGAGISPAAGRSRAPWIPDP